LHVSQKPTLHYITNIVISNDTLTEESLDRRITRTEGIGGSDRILLAEPALPGPSKFGIIVATPRIYYSQYLHRYDDLASIYLVKTLILLLFCSLLANSRLVTVL
jgi:hypothetical protein